MEDPGAEGEGEGDGVRTDDGEEAMHLDDFDRALPGLHTYLGHHLEDVRGLRGRHELRRMLTEEKTARVKLPVLVLDGVVLFPGDTLPLMIPAGPTDAATRRMLSDCLRAAPPLQGLFGIVHLNNRRAFVRSSSAHMLADVGTVAEIRQMAEGPNEGEESVGMSLTAIGRLRFRVARPDDLLEKVHGAWRGGLMGVPCLGVEVDLMAEMGVAPPGPPRGAFATGLNRHRAAVSAGRFTPSMAKRKPQSTLPLTALSAMVYTMFDAFALAERLHSSPYLRLMCGDADALPRDPTALSFWVASHVPASESQRARLLALPSTVGRLREELRMLRRSKVEDMIIACGSCRSPLSSLSELVVMSEEGASGVYVNPHGVVHDMFTVGRVIPSAVALEGSPETAHSWFPGYAWTVAYCRRCFNHLGWRFSPALPPGVRQGQVPRRVVDIARGGGDRDGNGEGEGVQPNSGAGGREGTVKAPNQFFGLRRAAVETVEQGGGFEDGGFGDDGDDSSDDGDPQGQAERSGSPSESEDWRSEDEDGEGWQSAERRSEPGSVEELQDTAVDDVFMVEIDAESLEEEEDDEDLDQLDE